MNWNICKPNKAILFAILLISTFSLKNLYLPNDNRYCHRIIYLNYIMDRKIDHNILFKLKDANKTIHKKVFSSNCHLEIFSNLKFNNLRIGKKNKERVFFSQENFISGRCFIGAWGNKKKPIIVFWPEI